MMIASEIKVAFGGQIRVRVCGVCIQNNKVLMINHQGINQENIFWSAPGGGLEYGETIINCLKREFEEECNLKIEVGVFLAHYEYINAPLHAIELFYEVKIIGGSIKLGHDPELNYTTMTDLKWMNLSDLKKLKPNGVHSHFQ